MIQHANVELMMSRSNIFAMLTQDLAQFILFYFMKCVIKPLRSFNIEILKQKIETTILCLVDIDHGEVT